ncbi:hypothetical protein Oweho_2877 [Owenweeksia hongkongensis DSM 17368]|uniref:Uncharacterized protein n=1 Tax=Owenweeksia hongkongensis (strain DSM 17368 / CIP 108786 / JCM 12287 / NRRL B-23963 / UST20020801) TaxID=926562 RepID=G8R0V8_OWEHD|nr:hypothetical protein [Owenweeksia hongkongensis]AEV33835.1 hypothetical protein Oweho_2877 [Owenweeksia hongkongensis DSM 17368]
METEFKESIENLTIAIKDLRNITEGTYHRLTEVVEQHSSTMDNLNNLERSTEKLSKRIDEK